MSTTTQLLSDVRLRGSIPDSAYTDAEILREADQAMWSEAVPFITRAKQEYWVTEYTTPLISGQREYRLPQRAIASTQRDVYLLDSSGRSFSLAEQSPVHGRRFRGDAWAGLGGFYLQGENLVLSSSASQVNGETLVISYERRPGSLVATSDCYAVASVGTAGEYVKAGTKLRLVVATAVASALDLVQVRPGFDTLLTSAITISTGASLSAGFLEFSVSAPAVTAGDFLCPATKSCVVQLPTEVYPLLVQATTVRLMEAEGDQQALAVARENLERMKLGMAVMISPRGRGSGKRIINLSSPLRSKRWGGY